MPQYNITAEEYVERNNNLFDVVQQSDENGSLWHRRYAKDALERPKSVSDHSPFNLSPDDIILISVKSVGGSNVKSSASLYFSEQI